MLSTDELLFTCNITRFKIRRIWKVNTKTRLMLSIKLTILRCIRFIHISLWEQTYKLVDVKHNYNIKLRVLRYQRVICAATMLLP